MQRPRELVLIWQRSKTDVVNIGGGLGADLEAGVLGLDDAVVDVDAGGLAIVDGLAAALDDYAVVAAGDVAVADLDVARVVGIDAVAVGHVEQVANFDVVDQHAIAAEHVQAPVWRFGEGDVADVRSLQPVRTNILGRNGPGIHTAAGVIVSGHELLGAALDVARAADGEALRAGGHNHRTQRGGHGVSGDRTGQAASIVFAPRADEEFGVVGEMEVDGALELDGADQVLMAAAHQYLGLAGVGRGLVDGALEGCAVERGAVARRAVLEHIEDFDLRVRLCAGRVAGGPGSATRTHGAERAPPLQRRLRRLKNFAACRKLRIIMLRVWIVRSIQRRSPAATSFRPGNDLIRGLATTLL